MVCSRWARGGPGCPTGPQLPAENSPAPIRAVRSPGEGAAASNSIEITEQNSQPSRGCTRGGEGPGPRGAAAARPAGALLPPGADQALVMALAAYRREAEQRYEAGRAALEDALGVLGALAQPASDPAALRAALAQAASLEAVGAGQANAEVGALVDKVQDVLVGVVRAFRGVESWITMSVPKIEDG